MLGGLGTIGNSGILEHVKRSSIPRPQDSRSQRRRSDSSRLQSKERWIAEIAVMEPVEEAETRDAVEPGRDGRDANDAQVFGESEREEIDR